MSTPVIETKHLTKYFQTPKGLLHAVEDVNLSISSGETIHKFLTPPLTRHGFNPLPAQRDRS